MPYEVELPDQIVEFPDDWSEDMVREAVKNIMGIKPEPKLMAPLAEKDFAPRPVPTSTEERDLMNKATLPEGLNLPRTPQPLHPYNMDPNQLAVRGVAQEAQSKALLPAAMHAISAPLAKLMPDESIAPGLTQIQALVSPTMNASIARQRMAAGDPNLKLENIVQPEGRKLAQQVSGVNRTVAETVNFFTSPLGIATFGMGALPKAAQAAISLAFATQMASAFPEIADELGREYAKPEAERDHEKIAQLLTSAGANAFFTAAAGKHGIQGATEIYASRIREAAKVHGDVRAQPGQGQGQVPGQEGSAGVQPQTEALAQKTSLPVAPKIRAAEGGEFVVQVGDQTYGPYASLVDAKIVADQIRVGNRPSAPAPKPEPVKTEADVAYEQAEREAMAEAENLGTKVQVLDELPPGDAPFAAGTIATIDSNGNILINRPEFQEWLKGMRPENRAEAIKSLVSEEFIHSKVPQETALSWWNNLTKAEQLIVTKRYTGKWKRSLEDKAPGERFSDTNMGHEALRGMIQDLGHSTPREIAETSGFGKLGMKALYTLEQAIFALRGVLDTKAHRAQIEMLDRAHENLKVAMAIRQGRVAPQAFNKAEEADPKRVAEMKPEEYNALATSWKAKAMRGEGLAVQRQAEHAALENPDLKLWEEGQAKADADSARILAEIKADPSTFMARQEEMMGAAMKSQFFQEGIKQIKGQGTLKPQETPAQAYRKGKKDKTGDLFSGQGPTYDPAKGFVPPPKEERVSAEEAGALPLPSANDLADKLRATLAQPMTPRAKAAAQDKVLEVRGNELFSTPIVPSRNDRPRFGDFTAWAERNIRGTTPDQLREVWQNAVWNELIHATPERLAEWREALNLEKKFGEREIVGPGQQPEPKRQPVEQDVLVRDKMQFGLEREQAITNEEQYQKWLQEQEYEKNKRTEAKRTATQELKESKKRIERSRNYRAKIITEVAVRLIEESLPTTKRLDRKEISIDDIDFNNRRTVEGAYVEIDRSLAKDVKALSGILRDQARSGSRTQGGLQMPITATKRLLVLHDRKTDRTHVVSAYRTPDGTVMVVDPRNASADRPNRPLSEVLKKSAENEYIPIASMLIDEPVQNFHQPFDTLAEFNNRIGKEAAERELANQYSEFAGEDAPKASLEELVRGEQGRPVAPEDAPVDPEAPRGTSVTRGEGGSVTGQHAALGRGILGVGRGELERAERRPLRQAEARALHEFLTTEAGEIVTREDFSNVLKSLLELAEEGRKPKFHVTGAHKGETLMRSPSGLSLKGIHMSSISAIYKIAESIQRRDPDLTPDRAYEKALEFIYHAVKDGTSEEAFIYRTMGEFTPPPEPVSQLSRILAPRTAPKIGVERELQTLRDIAPTTTRPEQLPSYYKPIKESPPPLPEASPGRFSEPEKLPPETQRMIQGMAAAKHPREPLQPVQSKALADLGITLWEPVKYKSAAEYYEWLRQRSGLSPSDYKGPESLPQAFNKAKGKAEDVFVKIRNQLYARHVRRLTEEQIVYLRDAADNAARIYANQSGNIVRAQSPDPIVRSAAKAVIAAGGVRSDLLGFKQLTKDAQVKAQQLLNAGDLQSRRIGRAWMKAAKALEAEVDFAHANWNNPALRATVEAAKRELKEAYDWETNNGINLRNEKNYVPGRYDAEFFNDNGIFFGQRVLGTKYKNPKLFRNYYEAIESGPYIPKSMDIGDIVEHRVRQGRLDVETKVMWPNRLRGVLDPYTHRPIVVSMVKQGNKWVPPNSEYVGFDMGYRRDPIAVRVGYKPLMNLMTMRGALSQSPVFKAALAVNGMLKHGVILIFDTFHPTRLAQYGVAAVGKNVGYKGGASALEYREADLATAVANGIVDPKSAAWASEPVQVKLPSGRMANLTRREILEQGVKMGLNVGRISDALYKDLIKDIPIVGKMNTWIFDKLTRGLMAENFVRAFEQANRTHPHVDVRRLMRDVVKDTNFYYGSIGRQGIFRNPTLQEISQLAFLAPQWVEGLIQKEARFLGRATGISNLTGRRGLPQLGMIGKGVGKGLAAYFVLTQVINLLTRQQFTWQNPEEGHKMDAWIPTGSDTGEGFWISPLSVFLEVTHDLMRYAETKPKAWDAIDQIGRNKLGPYGRLAVVLGESKTSRNEAITTTGGVVREAAREMTPVPISLGKPLQYAGSKLGVVDPPEKGAVARQLMGSFTGIKVQSGESAGRQIMNKAQRFVEENNLKMDSVEMTPTDAASYSKLRAALRNDNVRGAARVLEEIRKTRRDDQILEAMERSAKRNFTGSDDNETLFLSTLNPQELELYQTAWLERVRELQKFYEFFMQQP